MYAHFTIIVAAPFVELARSLAAGIAGEPGAGMFQRELSPTGAGPATHYISSGFIYAEFGALLGDAPATFTAAGGTVPLATIEAMYASSYFEQDVDPFAFMQAAGLKFLESQ